jgi:hypothetical protein
VDDQSPAWATVLDCHVQGFDDQLPAQVFLHRIADYVGVYVHYCRQV